MIQTLPHQHFFPASELARRLGVSTATVNRRAETAGITPDALMVAGEKRVPLFGTVASGKLLKKGGAK